MKTRIITAIVGIIVLIGVMFTFNTLIFNLVIAAITLIAIHEIYNALGFTKKDWLMYAALVPYTLLVMTSNYMVMRRLVMPVSFVLVTFYAIYLVVRNGTISYQKASGLLVFSGIVIFCFYSFIRLKELLPVDPFASLDTVAGTLTPQLGPDQTLLLVDLGTGANRLGGSMLAQVSGEFGGVVPDLDEPARQEAATLVAGAHRDVS